MCSIWLAKNAKQEFFVFRNQWIIFLSFRGISSFRGGDCKNQFKLTVPLVKNREQNEGDFVRAFSSTLAMVQVLFVQGLWPERGSANSFILRCCFYNDSLWDFVQYAL